MFWQNLSSLSKTLNITNGDCAVDALKKAGVQGAFLPWRDVLHIGPLLPGDLLGRFEQSRVLFLSQYFSLSEDEVKSKFSSRHDLLSDLNQYETIRLWFEHDLYDQLQLVQILAYLGQQGVTDRLRWVLTDRYLGPASESDVHELFRFDQPIPDPCWSVAAEVWRALTDSEPTSWHDDISISNAGMAHSDWPFLSEALQRFQSEFPDKISGLSLTQSLMLSNLSKNPIDVASLFKVCAAQEQSVFLADAVFMQELQALVNAKHPLVNVGGSNDVSWESECQLTATGRAVIEGKKNHVKLNGIDRWIGGVHLNQNSCWWFNKGVNQLEQ